MNVLYILEQLYDDPGFKAWKKSHSSAILAHIFFMAQGTTYSEYHVGYYDESTKRMTSFIINGTSIEVKEEDNLLKLPDTKILSLDETKFKLMVEEALEKAGAYQKEHHPKEIPLKLFVVAQNIATYGQIYNLTFVTQGMKTLNIKMDTNTGEIKFCELIPLFEMQGKRLDQLKKEKKEN